MKGHADTLFRRMEAKALEHDAPEAMDQGGYFMDAVWIVFPCGCRAERVATLRCQPRAGDPVIFVGLPEQAVYDAVCREHEEPLVYRLMGRYRTFDQWKRDRRPQLIGR